MFPPGTLHPVHAQNPPVHVLRYDKPHILPPFYFLDEKEIEKDWIQVKAAAEKLLNDINTSGNSRRGEAFVLVEKAGFDYHIYGSGDDRTVIRANKRDDDDK